MKVQDLIFRYINQRILCWISPKENTYRLNATCVDSSRTNAVDNEGHYLTDYAYNMVTEELLLSKACRAMRFDKTTYFVYTPECFT